MEEPSLHLSQQLHAIRPRIHLYQSSGSLSFAGAQDICKLRWKIQKVIVLLIVNMQHHLHVWDVFSLYICRVFVCLFDMVIANVDPGP